MLIRNGKAFTRGLILLASFLVVFVLFFMPIFPAQEEGAGKSNGLVFADHLFNTLSKGSSNFFDPTLQNKDSVDVTATRVQGKSADIEVPFKEEAQASAAVPLLRQAGMQAELNGSSVKIKGELYPLLQMILKDSLSTYNNKFDEVAASHGGADGREVMKTWWHTLTSMIKPLQRAGQVDEASVVSSVITKAIEPSYNFYNITPLRVVDNIPLVAGFLIFYVIYTMWYGFAIFEIFEGIGLSMKKGVKKEA
ncbi:hypothetical protein LJC59_04225 [Desulfovibrio sp. OttesenSCG-928-A18]|nr:hypothetical protein [Desulfovibrio sp. OttesenSCG-928-A18]